MVWLHKASYLSEWSIINIKPLVEKYGDDAGCSLSLYDSTTNNYISGSGNTCNITFDGTQDVFGGGKTGVNKLHLYYDHTTGNLYVYQGLRRNTYAKLHLYFYSGRSDSNGDDFYYEYRYTFDTPKCPIIAFSWLDDKGHHTNKWGKQTVYSHTPKQYPIDFEAYLIDPETEQVINPTKIYNKDSSYLGYTNYAWGEGYFYWAPGFTNAQTYHGEFSSEEASIYTGQWGYEGGIFENETGDNGNPSYTFHEPDEIAYPNFMNQPLEIFIPTSPMAYDENYYISFCDDFLGGGIELHFVVEESDTEKPIVNLYSAVPGETEITKMQPGDIITESGWNHFHIMYGFKQSYFISVENYNLGIEPLVTINSNSTKMPLKKSITRLVNKDKYRLYRIDFWVDNYCNPLDYQDANDCYPYSYGDSCPFDDQTDFEGDITIEINVPGLCSFERTIGYIINTKRHSISFNVDENNNLVPIMSSPMFSLGESSAFTYLFDIKYKHLYFNHIMTDNQLREEIKTIGRGSKGGKNIYDLFKMDYGIAMCSFEGSTHHVGESVVFDGPEIGEWMWNYFDEGANDRLLVAYPEDQITSIEFSYYYDEPGFISRQPGLSWTLSSSFNTSDFTVNYGSNLYVHNWSLIWSGNMRFVAQCGYTWDSDSAVQSYIDNYGPIVNYAYIWFGQPQLVHPKNFTTNYHQFQPDKSIPSPFTLMDSSDLLDGTNHGNPKVQY